ncbi:hypothetical protein [Alkalicoccus luteus]|uniref:Uncharacterized protein n=1 Tax=Alkalicoccus luteus TaxID=1237094 RepID=A0A969TTR4_9BACI|nr:hypothetical protein [Alkalicoccus luteus]NJP37928.1 hypothetical protein [Alkalicoccus luteus]
MNLSRLSTNHLAIKISYKRLEEAVENRDEEAVFISLSELLLWIITTEEWHKKYNRSVYFKERKEKGCISLMKGIRHAYNAAKHDMELLKFTTTQGGFSFPMEFPMEFGRVKVIWEKSDVYNKFSYEEQLKGYQKCLEGKEIMATLTEIIEFLNKQRIYREGR